MTKQEELQRQQEEILQQAYENWRQNPTTQLLFNRLIQLKNNHLQLSVNNASNWDVNDTQFRLDAYAAKTVDTIIKMINDVKLLAGKQ